MQILSKNLQNKQMNPKLASLLMREILRRKGKERMKHTEWEKKGLENLSGKIMNSAREWDITLYSVHSTVPLIMLCNTHQKN